MPCHAVDRRRSTKHMLGWAVWADCMLESVHGAAPVKPLQVMLRWFMLSFLQGFLGSSSLTHLFIISLSGGA